MKKLSILILLLPKLVFTYNVDQIFEDLKSYQEKIKELKGEYKYRINGIGITNIQIGSFLYDFDIGLTFTSEYPVKIVIEIKKNGEFFVNGEKKELKSPASFSDLFFLSILNNYILRIEKEDDNYVNLYGYGKEEDLINKKLINLRFNKKLKVIDYIQYLGTGYDYPYESQISYMVIDQIPVVKNINTKLVTFSTTIETIFDITNISLVKKNTNE